VSCKSTTTQRPARKGQDADRPVLRQEQGRAAVPGRRDGWGVSSLIPKDKERFVVKGTATVSDEMVLHDIMPHMHMLGKEIKVTITPPKASQAVVQHHGLGLQLARDVLLQGAVEAEAGTKIDLEAVYDNSVNNPHNPFNPPRDVTFASRPSTRCAFVFLGGTSNQKGTQLPVSRFGKKPKN